jgi:hypothetical protein
MADGLLSNLLLPTVAAEQVTKTPEPGEFSPEDLARRIYRTFAEREEDRRRLKSVASIDRIVSFLPSGGSRVKG